MALTDAEYDRITRDFPMGKTCPTCDGEGSYLLNGERHTCDCSIQKALARLYYQANIPRRYHALTLSDLAPEYAHDVPTFIGNYLSHFADEYHYGRGLGFYGRQGTGKTLVAVHILKQVVRLGYSGFFIQFTDLINSWGAAWKDAESKEVLERNLKRPDILVLDDIITDKRNISGFLQGGLEAVMRHRFNNALPTILTSNMRPEELDQEFPRAYSLLSGVTHWISMPGPSEKTHTDYRPTYYTNLTHLTERGERAPLA